MITKLVHKNGFSYTNKRQLNILEKNTIYKSKKGIHFQDKFKKDRTHKKNI